jgi:hypothetical protein
VESCFSKKRRAPKEEPSSCCPTPPHHVRNSAFISGQRGWVWCVRGFACRSKKSPSDAYPRKSIPGLASSGRSPCHFGWLLGNSWRNGHVPRELLRLIIFAQASLDRARPGPWISPRITSGLRCNSPGCYRCWPTRQRPWSRIRAS